MVINYKNVRLKDMRLKIIDPNQPINEKDIEYLESEKSISFPQDYKSFLLESNGGKPERNRYDLVNTDGNEYWIEIDYFYGLNEVEIHKGCEFCLDKEREFIFIAYSIKNQCKIAIDLSEPFKIRFFDYCHEIFFDLLANNFNEFINNFHPRYDNEYQRLCDIDDFDGLKKLLDSGFDVNTKDRNGKSILRSTIFDNYIDKNKYNYLEIIKILLKKGAYEKGLFAESCAWGDIELAKSFIDSGVNINETTNEEYSPLIWASISKSYELVELLLSHNANIDIKNKLHMSAVDYVLIDLKNYINDENILLKVKKIYNLLETKNRQSSKIHIDKYLNL
jgi:hypothetical protein